MDPGSLVDGRFEIEEEAGRGGMGVVYRAKDRLDGATVAVKVLPAGGAADRFVREGKVLARMSHPAIVRHVASGETDDGRLYLAMEWLEGEDLATRLARRGLQVSESLALTRRVAEALGEAHARGLVHRDVKPSNIWLVGGDVGRAKLLDFGIVALSRGASRALTSTGAFIGTLGYVAPEHADGSRDIDGRADLFSLGCVLYECLTGKAAIGGQNPLEVLAKSMLEGVPDVRIERPDLDARIGELVASMTARNRADRFPSAAALIEAIDGIELGAGAPQSTSPGSRPSRLSAEQRLVSLCLLLAAESTVAGLTTVAPSALDEQEKKVLALVRRFGGEMRALSNGLCVTLSGGSSALDLAVNATECALALRALSPDAEAVLAMGRMDARLDASAVVARAFALLERGRGLGLLRVDETTASLVSSRFVLRDHGGLSVVIGRVGAERPLQSLIGKPTPCVGRDKELALLDATLSECVEESVARVVLVTAPPGTGKSRLRLELVDRIEAARPEVRRLFASADAAASRASLSLAGALVLGAAGVPTGAPLSEYRGAITRYVAAIAPDSAASGPGVAEGGVSREALAAFLCELVGAPPEDRASGLLATARNEPRIMHEWMQRAFEGWLVAETRRGPVLLVLEDMHWADEASLAFLASAIRRCADAALMVLGLARPEIHETLPDALARIGLQEVRLGGLTRKAAERLVRFALPALGDAEVASIVERADGNAFFLEELVRWTERAGGGALPETVVLMLESRLEKLAPMARRVLRAASVFGGTAWIEGAQAILGSSSEVAVVVDSLVADEILVRHVESRFAGTREIAFRHALLREAAYAMLTPEDAREAHRLAAIWLEASGERDPLLLAEHHAHAEAHDRAAPLFLRAAQLAADAGNIAGVLALSARGLSAATGPTRAALRAIRAYAHGWRAEWSEVLELAPMAMAELPPGSVSWWLMAGGIVFASSSMADPRLVPSVMREVMALPGQPEANGPCGFAMTLFTLGSLSAGRADAAHAFAARCERIREEHGEDDLAFGGWLRLVRDAVAFYNLDDPATAYREVREGVARFLSARDPVGLSLARVYEGTVVLETGDARGAEAIYGEALRVAREADVRYSKVIASGYLARTLVGLGRAGEALTLAESLLQERDLFLLSLARAAAGEALMALGRPEEARRHAGLKIAAPATISLPQTLACSILARLSLAESKIDETLAHAEQGLAIAATAAFPRCRSELLMTKAEALSRSRRGAEAASVRAAARARVERIANDLALAGESVLRDAWLRLPANRLAML